MDILSIEPAACNAGPFPVRTAPARDAISFPTVLTDELFERWLDLRPDRRVAHERDGEKERGRVRAGVARMYALRGSPVTVAYARVLEASEALHDALECLLKDFGPNEAERVLKAAGLYVPHEHDTCQAYGAHTFQEQRKDCRRMKRDLGEFINTLHTLIYVLPNSDPDELRPIPPLSPQDAPAETPFVVETGTTPASPATRAEHEAVTPDAVTPDACMKAAWALTASAEELLGEVQEFNERFAGLADHKPLEQPIRDAVGVAWALDMYVSCQYGQLHTFGEDGDRLAHFDKNGVCLKPATNVAVNTRHAA